MLNGHDLDVDLPGDDHVRRERRLRRVRDEDAVRGASVALRPQPRLVAELSGLCATHTHTHTRTQVTGQLADTPTRGLPTRELDDSQTGQIAD